MNASLSETRRALVEPKAVAIVGASDDAGKVAGRPLQFLRRHGFQGKIFPINSRRQTVMGEKAYPSLRDVPEPVDHAYVLVPTAAAVDAVAECAACGVKAVTVLADGFAEAGEEGVQRQRQLTRIVAETGCRIVGPSSLGVVRTHNAMLLTANAAFAADRLVPGRYSVLSQSGSLIGTFFSRGRARGIGFANLISVGNEVDLSVGEIGEMLVDDPETDAFLLFLETIRKPEHMVRFAAAAWRASKPVIAYKLGRSAIGAELVVSHTGGLVGADAAANRFLHELGIARVDMFESLFEAPPLFRGKAVPRTAGPVAKVVTTTGGGGALVADRLGMQGIRLEGASEAMRRRLAKKGLTVRPAHIIDVTLAGARYEMMRAAMDAVLAESDADIVIPAIGSSSEFFPELAVQPIIDAVREAPAGAPPVGVFLVPAAERALKMLADAGIAAFRTPEACADAVGALLRRAPPRIMPSLTPKEDIASFIASASLRLNEREAMELFGSLGIPLPAFVVLDAQTASAIDQRADLPPFPLVAKLLSRDLPHKTEAGAVVTGITTVRELKDAIARMIATAHRYAPKAVIEGVLVQAQHRAIAEVLAGLRRDHAVGPVVTVGLGGTLAELYRDVAIRMAPVSPAEAREMIDEVEALATIRGYRGKPKGDLDALADAVVRLSELAAYERITEAEINPLLVGADGEGVVAVDGLVVLSAASASDQITNSP